MTRYLKRGFLLLLLGLFLVISFWEGRRVWQEHSQDEVILSASSRYGVHAALVKAVVWRESRFDPEARGSKGELGLMQLMPATAGEWAQAEKVDLRGGSALRNPEINTRAGTWYLRKLYQRYRDTDNPILYTLADFNAGRTHVLRWAKGEAATNSAAFLAQISFPGTRDYVVSVNSRFQQYRESFPPKPTSEPSL